MCLRLAARIQPSIPSLRWVARVPKPPSWKDRTPVPISGTNSRGAKSQKGRRGPLLRPFSVCRSSLFWQLDPKVPEISPKVRPGIELGRPGQFLRWYGRDLGRPECPRSAPVSPVGRYHAGGRGQAYRKKSGFVSRGWAAILRLFGLLDHVMEAASPECSSQVLISLHSVNF